MATKELVADKEVVLEAVKQEWHTLCYAFKELKADREVGSNSNMQHRRPQKNVLRESSM